MITLSKWGKVSEEPVIEIPPLELSKSALEKVKSGGMKPLPYLKMVAIKIAKAKGFVSIDDIREFAVTNGISNIPTGVWGSVFKGTGWKAISTHPSLTASNKGRKVTVWGWESKRKK